MQNKKIKFLVFLGMTAFLNIGFSDQRGLDFGYCSTHKLEPDTQYMIMHFKNAGSLGLELPEGYEIFTATFIDTFNRRNIELTCSRYLDSYKPYQNIEFSCSRGNVSSQKEAIHINIYRKNISKFARVAVIAFGSYENQDVDNVIPMFCE